MKSRSSPRHLLDMIFPLLLLLLLAIGSMLAILLGAKLYSRVSQNAAGTDNAGLAAAYLTEKIRQGDTAGAVRLEKLDGTDALVLEHISEGTSYCTYIYYYENSLRELMAEKGYRPALDRGRRILPLKGFQAQGIESGLFRFTCQDEQDNTVSIYASVQAAEEPL